MPGAFKGSAVGNRLKKHPTTLKISDRETMHSFRSGCSITLPPLGDSNDYVAHHVGWKSLATARYYPQTHHVMHICSSQIEIFIEPESSVRAPSRTDLDELSAGACAGPLHKTLSDMVKVPDVRVSICEILLTLSAFALQN